MAEGAWAPNSGPLISGPAVDLNDGPAHQPLPLVVTGGCRYWNSCTSWSTPVPVIPVAPAELLLFPYH